MVTERFCTACGLEVSGAGVAGAPAAFAPSSGGFTDPFAGTAAPNEFPQHSGSPFATTSMTNAVSPPAAQPSSTATGPVPVALILVGALMHWPLLRIVVATPLRDSALLQPVMTNMYVFMAVTFVLFLGGVLLLRTPWWTRGPGLALGLLAILLLNLRWFGVLPPGQFTYSVLNALIFLGWSLAAIRRPIMWVVGGPATLLIFATWMHILPRLLGDVSHYLAWFALAALVALVPPAPPRPAPAAAMYNAQPTAVGGLMPAGGYAPGGMGAPPPPTNTMAIVAFVGSFVFAPMGAILGHLALREIRRTGQDGRGLTIAALVLSYASMAAVLIFVLWAYLSIRSLGQTYGY